MSFNVGDKIILNAGTFSMPGDIRCVPYDCRGVITKIYEGYAVVRWDSHKFKMDKGGDIINVGTLNERVPLEFLVYDLETIRNDKIILLLS
jgi:hypothetical protein